jgi:hypothetical protein
LRAGFRRVLVFRRLDFAGALRVLALPPREAMALRPRMPAFAAPPRLLLLFVPAVRRLPAPLFVIERPRDAFALVAEALRFRAPPVLLRALRMDEPFRPRPLARPAFGKSERAEAIPSPAGTIVV